MKKISDLNGHVATASKGINSSLQNSRHLNKTLPEKEFKVRSSLLTEMIKIKEIQTVHNIILAVFVHFLAYSAVSDLILHGSIDLGFGNMKRMFGKPVLTFSIIVGMHLMPIIAMYPIFRLWTHLRAKKTSKTIGTVLDVSLFIALGNIFLATFYIPFRIHFIHQRLPMACSAAVVMEQLRIIMKMYAFIRTNFPRVFNVKNHKKENKDSSQSLTNKTKNSDENSSQLRQRTKILNSQTSTTSLRDSESESGDKFKYFDDNVKCPNVQKLIYFLYAPTFIYRDNYPRSNERRWSFILSHFAHAVGSILFYSFIHQRIGYVVLQDFGPQKPMTIQEILTVFAYQIVVGSIGNIIAWVTLLHSIQNIFGELLRFGDRGFYRDWWNSTSMAQYHRTWNTPVQDFLYNYVYKEAWTHGLGKYMTWLPALLVFSISNFFHEYAISFATQFFCPVMGLMFAGPGTFLTFLSNKKFPRLGNIFMHWSLGLGHAFIHMFYTMEHFSRVNNCPPAETPLKDFFIPRFLSCDAVRWS